MTASTPREVVVEFDGLYFKIQKLRGRRGLRGVRALQVTLGREGYTMITQPSFWLAREEAQLAALISVETKMQTGYDEAEQAMAELLAYTPDNRGQGVSFRDTPPDPDRPDAGWMPIKSTGTLDPYDQVDHTTWQSLRWEMIKLCYRPTSAATGTSAATPSAATTSTSASSHSGGPKTPPTGTPKAEIPVSGISGG